MIARVSFPIALLVACTHASLINAQDVAPGPFIGHPDVGTWEMTISTKSPTSDERTTTSGTQETKVILNGWYLESESKLGGNGIVKAIITADRGLKEFKSWIFVAAGNIILTTTGKWDEAKKTLNATGSDQYGNSVSSSTHRINDDKMETTLVVTSKDGVVLVDDKQTLVRKK